MADVGVREAQPGEVVFAISWRAVDGGLRGELVADNVSDRTVRLSSKPALLPLGVDGTQLDAHMIITLERRIHPFIDLPPGTRAAAAISWGGWNGPPASGRFIVRWQGGQTEVEADGPRQPEATGPPTNLSGSWFSRTD